MCIVHKGSVNSGCPGGTKDIESSLFVGSGRHFVIIFISFLEQCAVGIFLPVEEHPKSSSDLIVC